MSFAAHEKIVPLSDVVQTFTAMSGNSAVLYCPIRPGALLQFYSVRWKKNGVPIAELCGPSGFTSTDSRYEINQSTFSLTIDPANVNDSSNSYQCDVYVRDPQGDQGDIHLLPSGSPGLSLSLNVFG